jgi:hypothetical protein
MVLYSKQKRVQYAFTLTIQRIRTFILKHNIFTETLLDMANLQLHHAPFNFKGIQVPTAVSTRSTLSSFQTKLFQQVLSNVSLQLQKYISNVQRSLPPLSLNAVGIIALAENTSIAQRTALLGNSAYLDMFVLCPGLHRQQSAPKLNGGEHPAMAALTTGYVFRVENPATVLFLQSKGKTGHLVTIEVIASPKSTKGGLNTRARVLLNGLTSFGNPKVNWVSSCFYFTAASATPTLLCLFAYHEEWWGVFYLLLLMLIRLCNVVIIRRRCSDMGWKGASEPGVKGDLLVLLSGDRWIRMQGYVDDLKAVTSGQWWRDQTSTKEFISMLMTLFTYTSTMIVGNISTFGQVMLFVLFFVSAVCLFLANVSTTAMNLYGRKLLVNGQGKKYHRRRDLADELIRETGREDWAQRLGMVVDSNAADIEPKQIPVVM